MKKGAALFARRENKSAATTGEGRMRGRMLSLYGGAPESCERTGPAEKPNSLGRVNLSLWPPVSRY